MRGNEVELLGAELSIVLGQGFRRLHGRFTCTCPIGCLRLPDTVEILHNIRSLVLEEI
jgi:hypothetical protein